MIEDLSKIDDVTEHPRIGRIGHYGRSDCEKFS